MILDYYELLDIKYDSSKEDIQQAYQKKIMTAGDLMTEHLNTAYMTLTDPQKRQMYDISLGIHKYKRVPLALRIGKGVIRLILTVLDAFFSWYWCFLLVLTIFVTAYLIYKYKSQGLIDYMYFIRRYRSQIIIIGAISLIDLIFHYYIRRINRKLKHYNWEIK